MNRDSDSRNAFLSREVTPAESLLLAAAMAEARIIMDPAGNAKLAKNTQAWSRTWNR